MAEHGIGNIRKTLPDAEKAMHAGMACQDFFALQDQITTKISQAGDSLRRLLANKQLLERLKPVADDIDRELVGMQEEQDMISIFYEDEQSQRVDHSGNSESTRSAVGKLARLTLKDGPGFVGSRQ
jgi:hypothetical protein